MELGGSSDWSQLWVGASQNLVRTRRRSWPSLHCAVSREYASSRHHFRQTVAYFVRYFGSSSVAINLSAVARIFWSLT